MGLLGLTIGPELASIDYTNPKGEVSFPKKDIDAFGGSSWLQLTSYYIGKEFDDNGFVGVVTWRANGEKYTISWEMTRRDPVAMSPARPLFETITAPDNRSFYTTKAYPDPDDFNRNESRFLITDSFLLGRNGTLGIPSKLIFSNTEGDTVGHPINSVGKCSICKDDISLGRNGWVHDRALSRGSHSPSLDTSEPVFGPEVVKVLPRDSDIVGPEERFRHYTDAYSEQLSHDVGWLGLDNRLMERFGFENFVEVTRAFLEYFKSRDRAMVVSVDRKGPNIDVTWEPAKTPAVENDPVNHPKHYTSDPSGVECIEITRHRNFNIGNAIKYLWRAGLKTTEGDARTMEIQDLKKAVFYINDEIKRLEKESEK